MSVITFNLVRDSVIAALYQSFPNIDVYGEKVNQGPGPWFFVKLFSASQEQLLDRRYQRHHSFDIHYLPMGGEGGDEPQQYEDMHTIAETLYETLELIPISGGLMRGTKMRHEITNNGLHFFVDYNFRVAKEVAPDPLMQTMEQEGFIHG